LVGGGESPRRAYGTWDLWKLWRLDNTWQGYELKHDGFELSRCALDHRRRFARKRKAQMDKYPFAPFDCFDVEDSV
jgi:hypothetical protein